MIAKITPYLVGLLLILSVLLPVSATVNVISPGDTVFIGEENLDLTSFIQEPGEIGFYGDMCLSQPSNVKQRQNEITNNPSTNGGGGGGTDTYIGGEYLSGYETAGCVPLDYEAPRDIQDVNDPENFFFDPDIYWTKYGDWYLWDGENHGNLPIMLKEPSLKINVWDNTANKEITNQEIPQGHLIDFIIETNMWSVSERSGYTPEDAPISLVLTGPDGDVISSLNTNDGETISLKNLPVDSKEWSWVYGEEKKSSDKKQGWDTTTYEPGTYEVYAIADLNNIINTYTAPDGSKYTGKTISAVKTLEIKGEKSSNSKPEIVEEENPISATKADDPLSKTDEPELNTKNDEISESLSIDEYEKEIGEAWSKKDFNQVIVITDKAIEDFPDTASFWYWKSHAYERLGNYEKALEFTNKAILLNSSNQLYWLLKGIIYENMGNFSEAEKAFAKWNELLYQE